MVIVSETLPMGFLKDMEPYSRVNLVCNKIKDIQSFGGSNHQSQQQNAGVTCSVPYAPDSTMMRNENFAQQHMSNNDLVIHPATNLPAWDDVSSGSNTTLPTSYMPTGGLMQQHGFSHQNSNFSPHVSYTNSEKYSQQSSVVCHDSSTSTVECQICTRHGHIAKSCCYRPHPSNSQGSRIYGNCGTFAPNRNYCSYVHGNSNAGLVQSRGCGFNNNHILDNQVLQASNNGDDVKEGFVAAAPHLSFPTKPPLMSNSASMITPVSIGISNHRAFISATQVSPNLLDRQQAIPKEIRTWSQACKSVYSPRVYAHLNTFTSVPA